ncbi:MAG: cation:proton antiporter [Candidatus Eiseniibacteriota bacterium]
MGHELTVLRELALLAGVSVAVNLLFRRIRLPTVVGFLFTGVLIGPGGFALVEDPDTVNTLAEIGVVLLLFAVGLEFSLADLRMLGRKAAVAGVLQVLGTAAGVTMLLVAFGQPPAHAIFFGLLIAPSSTALVFRLITDRGELQAPHGRLLTGVLLVQDLAVVPMVLLVPALVSWSKAPANVVFRGPGLSPIFQALALVGLVVVAFMTARQLIPWLIARAAHGKSRETFLSAVVAIVLGSAWLSQQAGLSLALGAFLAGLILAESDLRSQIIADILPFRDTLMSIFFISIGMLLVPSEVLKRPDLVVAATVGMVLWKFVAASITGRIAGYPWRTAIAAGLGLAHIGEFSFVLAQAGQPGGLLPAPWNQSFYAGAVFSIMITPWLVTHAPEWSLRIELGLRALRPAPLLPLEPAEAAATSTLRQDHVVIGGYGLNGRNVARVLRAVHIPHIVLDLAPEAITQCVGEGSPTLIGNITQPEILKQAGAPRARVLVLALSDPFASRHATRIARDLNPHLFIIVRTRAVGEIDALHEAGASIVIPEEFETSIEIFTAVLREYHIPPNIVEAQIKVLRTERYSLLRGRKLPRTVIQQLQSILIEGTTEAVVLLHQSPVVGQVLWETGLLDEEGVKVVAIVRGGHAMVDFDPQIELRVGDTIVLTGDHAAIDKVMEKLAPADPRDPATVEG